MPNTHRLVLLVWLAAACSDDTTPIDAASVDAPAIDAAIDAAPLDAAWPPQVTDHERLAATEAVLADEDMAGRLTGTPSGDAAEAYLRAELTAAGIEVQTQDVTFPLFVVAGPADLSIVDDTGAPTTTFAYIDDFREVDFSGDGEATADLTFVGHGIVIDGVDPYDSLDVSGKIVAIMTGVPTGSGLVPEDDGRPDTKIALARDHGAAGILFVLAGDDLTYNNQDPPAYEIFAADKYYDIHPDLLAPTLPVAFIQPGATQTLLGRTVQQLAANPAPFDTSKRLHLEIHGATHEAATCRNVFGVFPGQDPTVGSEVILIGAHYDHLGVGADGRIFYGAADNASGTSVNLEAARTLAASPVPPQRTVVFAFFCAEEQILRGSLAYYYHPVFAMSSIKLMVQVDYLDDADGPYIANLDDQPIAATFLGDSMTSAELPVMSIDWGGECASDDCVFLWSGIPTYRFISYGDHHHRTTDTLGNINFTMLDRVADVVVRGIGNVAY
jgi:aminopeptidase YwaD